MIDPSFLRKRKAKWRYPLGAVLLHIIVIGGVIILEIHYRREMIKDDVKKLLSVTPITNEDLQKLMTRARVVETEWSAEALQRKREGRAYLGEKTQRVQEESRAKESGHVQGKLDFNKVSSKKIPQKTSGLGRKLKGSEKSVHRKGTYEILDPSIKISSKTILNTDAFVYAIFANRMKESIAAAWMPRWRRVADRKKQEMSVGIYVTVTRIFIERDGSVSRVTVDRSAGIPELDKAAVDSIYEVRSFPNPPPDLFGPRFNGNFDFTFMISLVPGSAFRFNFVPDQKFDQ